MTFKLLFGGFIFLCIFSRALGHCNKISACTMCINKGCNFVSFFGGGEKCMEIKEYTANLDRIRINFSIRKCHAFNSGRAQSDPTPPGVISIHLRPLTTQPSTQKTLEMPTKGVENLTPRSTLSTVLTTQKPSIQQTLETSRKEGEEPLTPRSTLATDLTTQKPATQQTLEISRKERGENLTPRSTQQSIIVTTQQTFKKETLKLEISTLSTARTKVDLSVTDGDTTTATSFLALTTEDKASGQPTMKSPTENKSKEYIFKCKEHGYKETLGDKLDRNLCRRVELLKRFQKKQADVIVVINYEIMPSVDKCQFLQFRRNNCLRVA